MVKVPAGEFTVGIDPELLPQPKFDCSDATPASRHVLPDFFIDALPVTNAQYDAWATSAWAQGHVLCHPDEPEDKDHRRGTRRDPRLQHPDHPVAGIDWYDACAYCAHHGKELPSELEWEKAARGTDGRLYPWGNEWDPTAVRWAGAVFGCDIPDIHRWRQILQNHDETFPAELTVPVGSFPRNRSPYGVMDLVGNTWEWTRTNIVSRQDMQPEVKGRPRAEWITADQSFPVIRGGAWSSIPEEISTFFRGRDLLTDRHNEIGFRGVVR
jgi:formylglycine-generating enzyme required for sulfatase activity